MRTRVVPALFGAALRLAPRSLPIAALVASAIMAVPRPAEATLAREITLRQLVVRADLAVIVTPEESTAVWEDLEGGGKRIVTYTRLRVGETVFGPAGGAASSKDVWVRTLGGIVGEIGQQVEGEAEFRTGERSLVFLLHRGDGTHVVIDMAQGHYPITAPITAPVTAPAVPPPASAPGGPPVAVSPAVPRLRLSPRLGGLVKQETISPLARVLLHDRPLVEAIKLLRDERKAAGL